MPVRCQNNLSFTDEDEVLVTSSRRRRTNPPVAFSSSEDESDPVVSKHSSTRVNNRTPMTTAAGSTESPNTPKSCPRGHLNVSSKRNSRPQRTTFATNLISSSGSNSSEDLIATPKKRRLVAKKTLSEFENESEDSDNQVAEDLREDLDALQDSGELVTTIHYYFSLAATCTRNSTWLHACVRTISMTSLKMYCLDSFANARNIEIHKKRTRGVLMSSTKTVKQKQLDILKRRRARPKIVELSSNSETMTLKSPRASGTRLQDSDQTSENDVSDEENSGIEAIRQSLRAGDNENDSGVDEDDNGTLGAPDWLKDIPLEFSRHTTKKPIENFKLAVEWMVHNKLNPAFARYDMIYDIAARKLDDQIQGFSGSKFLSPVWTKEFLGVLKSRPELSLIDIPTMFDHKCDACNRSGHPATRQLIFSGKPYNRVTLENLSSDEDSEESDNPHSQEESRPFYLGR